MAPSRPSTATSLADAFKEALENGCTFSREAGASFALNLHDALAHLDRGGTLGASVGDTSFEWPLDSRKKFEEFVYAESGKTAYLPDTTRSQLRLLRQLRRADVRFYSRRLNTYSVKCKVAPLWLLEKGRLWARHKGGEPFQVTDLASLAARYVPPEPPPAVVKVAVNPAPLPPASGVAIAWAAQPAPAATPPAPLPPPASDPAGGAEGGSKELDWTANSRRA